MRLSLLVAVLAPLSLFSAPVKYGWIPSTQANEQQPVRDDTREQLLLLRSSLQNLEIETKKLKEKLLTQDATFDALRDEVEKLAKLFTEQKNSREQSDKFRDLEETIAQQNRNLDAIDAALRTMMEAVGLKNSPVHVVKTGDSLGEIANKYHTTIDSLKKINQLKNDKIVVGQKIKIQ